MTPEIQALITKLEQEASIWEQSPLERLLKEAAAALVQQAQEKDQDPTRVDGQTVMPPERATAAEKELGTGTFSARAENLWEELGGDLCICQRYDVPHWCEKCQQRIELIALGMARAVDAVARADGTSTSGPRALDHLLNRAGREQFERAEDLKAQLASVTAERDGLNQKALFWIGQYEKLEDKLEAAEAEAACVKAQLGLVQQVCETAANNLARAEAAEVALSEANEMKPGWLARQFKLAGRDVAELPVWGWRNW